MSFKERPENAALFEPDPVMLVSDCWGLAVDAFSASALFPVIEPPRALLCDARDLRPALEPGSVNCVITSPPYPNRMSYIMELRPYMYWLGYLADARAAGELDWQAIGGTWGCATSNVGKWKPLLPRVLPHEDFESILAGIASRSDLLSRCVHKYFYDIADHVAHLKGLLAPGATLHYIVGNSKFYDVMVPVQELYAALFEQAGFEDVRIEPIRKRALSA